MTGHDDYIEFLRPLSPAELEREVRAHLADALQELVACIERALPLGGNTLHGCVVDEFQLQRPVVGERECRAALRVRRLRTTRALGLPPAWSTLPAALRR